MKCTVCPRRCGADRQAGERGVCGADASMRVAHVMLHAWEEPCLTATGKAGAIFFSGCSLGCVYCQNRAISHPDGALPGEIYTAARLAEEMLALQQRGASCIDLVTPTHYAAEILSALSAVRQELTIPVVWNTGGYETVETVEAARGLVDIFLTDMKYGTSETAARLSRAPDYPTAAAAALRAMVKTVGAVRMDGERMLSGVIVRHLVLPGCRQDSIAAMRLLAATVSPQDVLLSLMRQYTPDFAPPEMRQLRRRVTTFEYESVRHAATELGFIGYGQEADSASAAYTPTFTETAREQP